MRTLALFACTLSALLAQAPASPPAPGAPRPYKLPPVFQTQLPNGLTVLLIDDARVPLATVRLVFPCGNRRDPKDAPGLAAAVAEMLTQGTTRRNYIQIAEAIDGLGGTIAASSGADHVAVTGSIDARNVPALLAMIADVGRNAEFPSVELALYKQNRKQQLSRQHAQPAFVANEVFRKALFGEHPYAHIGPTAASLEALTREALVAYRDTWMVPNNAYLIAVGKLPARADTMKLITDDFGTWERKTLPEVKPEPLPQAARKLILVDRPGSPQADVRMGTIAATQHDADYFGEITASLIVGGVPMGRMFHDLREQRGFVYDIRAEHVAFDEAGILTETTQVRNEAAGETVRAMMNHLDRMAAEPVTEQELADAKSQETGSFLLRLEPQAGLIDELMIDRVQKLPANYPETWRGLEDAVTAADVQAAAKKYMNTGGMVVVVVGDAAKIGPALEKVGKFEVMKSIP